MNNCFTLDLYRYYGDDCHRLSTKLRGIFCTLGIQYTYLLRKAQSAPLFKALWIAALHICKIITSIQIPYSTHIAPGLRILHFGNIVVNPSAKIGKNFNIAKGVFIGGSEDKNAGYPVIGDNCCAFANSIIISGFHIGIDVLIAPGAFVNFDVPDNAIVIG